MVKKRPVPKYRLYLKSSGIPAAFLILAFSYSNCSNTKLSHPLIGLASLNGSFYLTPPNLDDAHNRYIFLVDMTNSMIAGQCDRDVDGLGLPMDIEGTPCRVNTALPLFQTLSSPYETFMGVDMGADRLTIIKTWLTKLQASLSPSLLANAKFLIVPFSGGQKDLDRDKNDGSVHFRDINQSLSYLALLQTQHDTDRNAQVLGPPALPQFMGTSVPGKRVTDIFQLIRTDMEQLSDSGNLHSAHYEMVYLSDGVPRPRLTDVQKVIATLGCPLSCSTPSSCSPDCQEIQADIKKNWGDNAENFPSTFSFKMQLLKGLPNYFGEGSFNLDLVLMHKDKIPLQELTDSTNLLLATKTAIPEAKYFEQNSSTIPFEIYGTKKDVTSYKLTSFYALNTNVRVNSQGKIDIDSDGDGIFDADEIRLNLDPKNPRTNGVCLDSIAIQPAFKDRCNHLVAGIDCDPTLDSDGDSLSECDELVLGTSKYDFDSDDDTIPDSLELIYGFNPNGSDQGQDTNGDGVPNLLNFASGLMPRLYPAFLPSSVMTKVTKKFIGYQELQAPDGTVNEVERYNIVVSKIPVAATLPGVKAAGNFHFSKGGNLLLSSIPPDLQILTSNTNSSTNTILFLARAVNIDNPDHAYWWILKKEVPVSPSGTTSIEVDLSKLVPMKWALDPKVSFGSGGL